MLNAEKYKDEIQKILDRGYDIAIEKETKKIVACDDTCCDNCALNSKSNCSLHIERWLISEYKEPTLTEEEKAYLSAVIKPFRNEVLNIEKKSSFCEWISILMESQETINLPFFEEGTIYKGMEGNRKYTIEELGL